MEISRFGRFEVSKVSRLRGSRLEVRGWMFRGFEVRAPRLEVGAAGCKVLTFGGFKVSIFEVRGWRFRSFKVRPPRLEVGAAGFKVLTFGGFKVSM